MTEIEANGEVEVVAGLFPRTNPVMLSFLRDIFKGYDQPIVRRAILEYANGPDEFIDRTKLRATIENLMGNGPKVETSADRIKAALAESSERWRNIHAEREQTKISAHEISVTLANFSDEQLEEMKARVIEHKPDLKHFLARSDVRTGKTIRYFMAQMVLETAAV
jgi:chromatin segregation and condensation protein Rec8/ScpA/Scc1 (kleisin family)